MFGTWFCIPLSDIQFSHPNRQSKFSQGIELNNFEIFEVNFFGWWSIRSFAEILRSFIWKYTFLRDFGFSNEKLELYDRRQVYDLALLFLNSWVVCFNRYYTFSRKIACFPKNDRMLSLLGSYTLRMTPLLISITNQFC